MKPFSPVLALGLVFAFAACDPCTSVTGCTDRTHLTITGRILREETAAPAAGARVDFVRTGGVALDADSLSTTVDAEGLFTLRSAGANAGLVTGELVVRSAPGQPDAFSYRVLDQTLRVFPDVGDANILPVWSTRPSLPDIAILTDAGVPPERLEGVQIEFRRTAGVRISEGDVFQTTIRDGGIFPLFDRQVHPVDAGEIIGDLYVGVNGLVVSGMRIRATPEFRRNPLLYIIDATP